MSFVDYPLTVDLERIVADTIAQLQTALGVSINEGDPIVALAEAVALRNAETRIVTVDVARAIFRDHGLKIYGVAPIDAASASALTTWTAADSAGYTIPAGTLVTYPVTGDQRVAFAVVVETVIPPGSLQAVGVEVQAVIAGSAANDLPAATVQLVDPLTWVASVVTTTTTSGGVDAESSLAYLDRLTAEIRAASTGGLVLPEDYATAARRLAGVHRALVIDGYSPGRTVTDGVTTNASTTVTSASAAFTAADVGRNVTGAGIPAGATIVAVNSATSITLSAAATASATGVTLTFGALTGQERTVTVVVVDEAGNALSVGVKAAVQAELEARREVNFLANVADPDYTAVTVNFAAVSTADSDPVQVQTAAIAAVEAYLDPGLWAGGDESPPAWRDEPIRYFELVALIDGVDGIDYITSLTVNGGTADVTLTGVAPLPNPTVTGAVT